MHNSTCELYKGLIHLMGLCSTRHGGEEYAHAEREEILNACLWEKLRGAREVGWGDFFELRPLLCTFYWLMKMSARPGHRPQLTPMDVHVLAYRSCFPLDIRVKGKRSRQLLLLSCAFWKGTVLLPLRVLGRSSSGNRQSNRTVIFAMFRSFFFGT